MEIWKDIIWYEWLYQVSNLGNVKSLNYYRKKWVNRILIWGLNNKWYLSLNLYKNKKRQHWAIARLVAQAFIPNLENKPQVNHINWIRDDNRVENLEWVTNSENIIHSFRFLWKKNNFQINHPKIHQWKFWKDNHLSKKVNQYDLNWNFIKEYGWVREAERLNKICNISLCCNWKLKTAWGFIWKF